MRVDAPQLFEVAMLLGGVGSLRLSVPAFFAPACVSGGGPNAVFATVNELFHIAYDLLLTIGQVIADAVRAKHRPEP